MRRPAVPSPVSLAAGVDIGGSKVLAVALDEDREVLAQVRLLVLTCDVETVVLGGGVTEVGRPLIDAVVAAFASGDSTGLTVPR